MSTVWAAWGADWLLDDKVSFDGASKIIYVHPEVTALDIRSDLYTSWVDWINLRDNLKFLPALRTTGFDSIGGGSYTGDVYFLINGWKLSVDTSKVRITGVLYSDDYDTAYYTPNMVAQYPVKVAALVNTVSVGGGSGGATAIEIRTELDSHSTKLSSIDNKVQTLSNGPNASSIASAVRTELSTEMAHVLTLNNNPGLTNTQAAMLLEMFILLGLDPTKPLLVTPTSRSAGSINQQITSTSAETVVVRV